MATVADLKRILASIDTAKIQDLLTTLEAEESKLNGGNASSAPRLRKGLQEVGKEVKALKADAIKKITEVANGAKTLRVNALEKQKSIKESRKSENN
jgi:hypothetical protein